MIKIYKYENQINGKVYVGQTKQTLLQRAGSQGQKYKKCPLFYNAIQKYGWDNFIPTILEEIETCEEANDREQYWIAYFDAMNHEKGYNLYSGGLAHEVSDLARQHVSEAQRNKTYKISEETRKKMSEAHKGKCSGPEHYLWGKHLPEETKRKLGEKLSNGKNPTARKVQCIETGEIFDTISLASQRCNNGSSSLRSHIAQQIKGIRKSCDRHPITGEKLHWRYIDEICRNSTE